MLRRQVLFLAVLLFAAAGLPQFAGAQEKFVVHVRSSEQEDMPDLGGFGYRVVAESETVRYTLSCLAYSTGFKDGRQLHKEFKSKDCFQLEPGDYWAKVWRLEGGGHRLDFVDPSTGETVAWFAITKQEEIRTGGPAQQAVTLTNKEVLDLLGAGLSPKVVVAKIKASACMFDTSPATLNELKAAGVPESVILAMISASPVPARAADGGTSSVSVELPAEVLEDRARRDSQCPECRGVVLYYVDAKTTESHVWWLSDNQRKWFEKEKAESRKRGGKLKFWSTKYAANADYLIFWTEAQGFRPYVYYVPRTQTETGAVSGSYRSFGSGGYDWGTFNGTVRVEKTYYEEKKEEWPYLDVVMTLYDARTGEKLYESYHQGNWRWSKPEKDCLVDVVKFLRQRHP